MPACQWWWILQSALLYMKCLSDENVAPLIFTSALCARCNTIHARFLIYLRIGETQICLCFLFKDYMVYCCCISEGVGLIGKRLSYTQCTNNLLRHLLFFIFLRKCQ